MIYLSETLVVEAQASGAVSIRTKRDGVLHRALRVPGNDLSDLPKAAQAAIESHWTPERIAAWEESLIPPEEPTAEELVAQQRVAEYQALPERQDMLDKLMSATPEQMSNWVDNNMNNLADARMMVKRILVILATSISR